MFDNSLTPGLSKPKKGKGKTTTTTTPASPFTLPGTPGAGPISDWASATTAQIQAADVAILDGSGTDPLGLAQLFPAGTVGSGHPALSISQRVDAVTNMTVAQRNKLGVLLANAEGVAPKKSGSYSISEVQTSLYAALKQAGESGATSLSSFLSGPASAAAAGSDTSTTTTNAPVAAKVYTAADIQATADAVGKTTIGRNLNAQEMQGVLGILNSASQATASAEAARPTTQTTTTGTTAPGTSGVVSPVGPGLTQGRTDQGVDYTGAGPLYAVGAGQILSVTASGWPGNGAFIALKLDNPVDAQHSVVYYAEDINASVKPGDHVTAGQVVGQATGGSTGIEIGWANPKSPVGETLAKITGGYTEGQVTQAGKDFLSFINGSGAPAATTAASSTSAPGTIPPPQTVYQMILAAGGSPTQAAVGAALTTGIESSTGSPIGELSGGKGPAAGLFQFEPGTWKSNGGTGGTAATASIDEQIQVFLNATKGDHFGAWGPDVVTNRGNPNSTSNPAYGYTGGVQAGSVVANAIAKYGLSGGATAAGASTSSVPNATYQVPGTIDPTEATTNYLETQDSGDYQTNNLLKVFQMIQAKLGAPDASLSPHVQATPVVMK